ncbi:MAG TPA: O-antigen ligase family protein [Flavobacteriales bacterium]|nr:O-antigen ligase family protein [Flavobacteriales bacterium]HMR27217.1 O-antigen ligase family protein [Flavobacteriales bacterium]
MRRVDHRLDHAASGVLLLLAAQALWPLQATGAMLIAFAAVQLTRAMRQGMPDAKRRWPLVLALGLPFLLLALRAPFCDDPHAAWLSAERTVPLLLLPVLLLLAPPPPLPRRVALDVFSGAALVLGMRGMLPVLFAQPDVLDEPRALREAFAANTGMHAVYAAYHLFLAALVQTAFLVHRRSATRIAGVLTCALLGALLASRMPALAFLIAFAVIMLRSTGGVRRRVALPLATLLVLMLIAAPTLRGRWKEAFTTPATVPITATTDTGERWALVHCGLSLLEDHAITGIGPDRVRGAMDECLRGIADGAYADGHHGPHDQLFLWWIGLGLPGAIAFVLLFAMPLREAIRRKDALHVALLAFLALCCLTEDLLDRQWGVVLFAFLNTWSLAKPGTEAQGTATG